MGSNSSSQRSKLSMSRESSSTARLARLGFSDTQVAENVLSNFPIFDRVLDYVKDAADPDLALQTLGELGSTGAIDFASYDEEIWRKVAGLLGASTALGSHLVKNPSHCSYVISRDGVPNHDEFVNSLLTAVTATKDWETGLTQLRLSYRKELSLIAALDVAAKSESANILPGIAAALSDLADAVIEAALYLAKKYTPDSELIEFAVIAMGKCGARELNYVSDVDVLFVVEPVDQIDETTAI